MPDTTVPELLDRRAADTPEQGVVFPDGRASYPELAVSTRRLAAALWDRGVRPGDAVGVLLHGGLDSVRCWLAAARLGAVTVPVNVRFRSAELAHVVADADLRVLLTTGAFVPLLSQAFPELPDGRAGALTLPGAPLLRDLIVLDDAPPPPGCTGRAALGSAGDGGHTAGDTAGDTSGAAAAVRAAQDGIRAGDPVVMLYTSGTTSRPRGCVHSHASLVHLGTSITERLRLTSADRFWTPLPMFHVGGIDVAMAALAGRCGFVHVGTFDADTALRQLAEQRCTVAFPAFETIWLPVLDHPDFDRTDLSALRLVINVGSPERMRMMQARVPGAVQLSCLGMTESCGFCCVGSPDDPPEVRATTSGRPLPGMEVRVVDPQTGAEVPPGTPGELRFRGVSRMLRYHRDPELTARRTDDGGWFASGDQVVADEAGRLRFRTRLGDILKVGGENVAAAEVEDFLCAHPAVGIVQVVGVPDARYGEVPAAFVQLRPGATGHRAGAGRVLPRPDRDVQGAALRAVRRRVADVGHQGAEVPASGAPRRRARGARDHRGATDPRPTRPGHSGTRPGGVRPRRPGTGAALTGCPVPVGVPRRPSPRERPPARRPAAPGCRRPVQRPAVSGPRFPPPGSAAGRQRPPVAAARFSGPAAHRGHRHRRGSSAGRPG